MDENAKRMMDQLKADPAAFNTAYLDNLALCAARIDGALQVVKTLFKQYKLVLVTNGVSRAQHRRMEASRLKKIVSECDAHAFVTVCDVHEALGEGFSYRHIS